MLLLHGLHAHVVAAYIAIARVLVFQDHWRLHEHVGERVGAPRMLQCCRDIVHARRVEADVVHCEGGFSCERWRITDSPLAWMGALARVLAHARNTGLWQQ